MIFLIYERNSIIGNGHFMRCKSLQEFIEGKHPGYSLLLQEDAFVLRKEEKNIYILDFSNGDKSTALIRQLSGNNLVVTFDYFSNDASPDFNISVFEQFLQKRNYPAYTGLEYSIIRSVFLKQKIADPKPNNIFVYIGGNGYRNVIDEITEKLNNNGSNVKLIRNNYSEPLGKLPDNFEIFYEPANLPDLMNNSFMAITSPGLTTMELLYLQVPSVLYPLNSQHDKFSTYFVDNNLALETFGTFRQADPARIELVKNTGAAIIDGKANERIINLIMHHYEQKMGSRFTLRK